MSVLMKRLLAGSVLATALASTPGLAQEADAYRETRLGLYVSAVEAFELLQENERAVLIDVRDPIEIKFTGFAEPTDIHVPWVLADRGNFDDEAKTWPMVRNADFEPRVKERLEALGVAEDDPIIVICRSGSTRSAPGADAIAEMGYRQVYSVSDGFEGSTLKEGDSRGVRALNGWRNSGLPWSYEIDPGVAWRPADGS
ncbi:rhodanese-like domain-containing protein [Halomonas sp. C05BenzN]|uniref:rhodanese-like domain-containing protein n=1 Tax=Halomonas sp. C05BenzN TaxID=3411041 RepID=UPI003B937C02